MEQETFEMIYGIGFAILLLTFCYIYVTYKK
jgi:hypothetical protein